MSEQFNPAGNQRKTIGLPGEKAAQAPQPQPARVEAEQKARRRRADTSELRNMKLRVPKDLLDPKYEYRWINDKSSGRIQDKTVHDDWDIVNTLGPDKKEVPVVRNVGSGEHGQPMKAYLCRKPKEFYEEDRAKAEEAITKREEGLRRGTTGDPKGLGGPHAYVPRGHTNVIERGG
jgi:hypothetical protein